MKNDAQQKQKLIDVAYQLSNEKNKSVFINDFFYYGFGFRVLSDNKSTWIHVVANVDAENNIIDYKVALMDKSYNVIDPLFNKKLKEVSAKNIDDVYQIIKDLMQ